MIDIAARVIGKPAPFKIRPPLFLLIPFAPMLERAVKLPKGLFGDLIKGMERDTKAINEIIQYRLIDFENAVRKAPED